MLKGNTKAPALVAQLDVDPTGDQVAGSTPARSATFFVEIDHEIFVSFRQKNVHNTG